MRRRTAPRRSPRPSALLDLLLVTAVLVLAAGYVPTLAGGVAAWWEARRHPAVIDELWPELTGEGGRLGAPDPEHVLVVFTDYRCPYCRAAEHALDSLLHPPPREGDLRGGDAMPRAGEGRRTAVVVRHLPVRNRHPDAPVLAAVAVCAEATPAFERVHDALFDAPRPATPAALRALLERADVEDPLGVLTCAGSEPTERRLARDRRLAAALRVRGTPTFVAPGALEAGALSLERLRRMLGLPRP